MTAHVPVSARCAGTAAAGLSVSGQRERKRHGLRLFSFADSLLKGNGLKMVVVFVPERFQLEVWLSGVNRAAQCRCASRLGSCPPPMECSSDPAHTDYLVRLPVEADLADGEAVVQAMKHAVEQLLALLSLQ